MSPIFIVRKLFLKYEFLFVLGRTFDFEFTILRNFVSEIRVVNEKCFFFSIVYNML